MEDGVTIIKFKLENFKKVRKPNSYKTNLFLKKYEKILIVLFFIILLIFKKKSYNTKTNTKKENQINININNTNVTDVFEEDKKIENQTMNLTKTNQIDKPDIDKKKENQTKNFTNYIHIALNIDNKYINPCIVSLTSLLDNRANSTFYIIHILIGNIYQHALDKILETIDKFGKKASNVTFYYMGDQFRGATTGQYISIAAYYRIALPSLLPDVDKIIYFDSDIINFKDLTEMYNIEFKEKMYFCGILDYIGLLQELNKLGVNTDKYMNTGVLLINLKAMRNDSIEDEIRKYISSHFLDHHEQTAINAVCYNNIQILSYKYASFSFDDYRDLYKFNMEQNIMHRYNETELNQSFYEPTLLHFPGYTKPWDRKCNQIKRMYWWYYAKKSIVYEDILNYYGFNKEEIESLLHNIPPDGGLLKRKYQNLFNKN